MKPKDYKNKKERVENYLCVYLVFSICKNFSEAQEEPYLLIGLVKTFYRKQNLII